MKPRYQQLRDLLTPAQRARCGICGHPIPDGAFVVDHIIGRLQGGTDAPDNIHGAHPSCNSFKGPRSLAWAHANIEAHLSARAARRAALEAASDGWTPTAIRSLRLRLGLAQDDFAALLCARAPTVSRWEAGATRPLRAFRTELTKLAAGIRP